MENQVIYTSPESMGLPPGYRFCPSKKQLIEYYLIKKINGESIPNNPVKDCDLYGDPRIWRKLFEETGLKTLYFYTKIKNRQRRKRVARTTEFGTWRGEGNIRIYDDDDDEEERDDFNKRERNHIGTRTAFSFAEKNAFEHNANWTMHEYQLDGIYQNMQNEVSFFLLSFLCCVLFINLFILSVY